MRLLKTFVVFYVLSFPNFVNAENSGNKWNFYTGMFDFSDDGKKSNLFGIQHINEDLYKETYLINNENVIIKKFIGPLDQEDYENIINLIKK